MPAAKEKKEFAWDNEKHLGFLPVHSHKQIEVKRVSMEGKQELILFTEWKYFKTKTTEADWNAVKGMTVPLSQFSIAAMMLAEDLRESPEVIVEAEENDNE